MPATTDDLHVLFDKPVESGLIKRFGNRAVRNPGERFEARSDFRQPLAGSYHDLDELRSILPSCRRCTRYDTLGTT